MSDSAVLLINHRFYGWSGLLFLRSAFINVYLMAANNNSGVTPKKWTHTKDKLSTLVLEVTNEKANVHILGSIQRAGGQPTP
jgi:hypothetical protein